MVHQENETQSIHPGKKFCRECGAPLTMNIEVCSGCGVPTDLYFANKIRRSELDDRREMRLLFPVGRPFSAIAAGYLGLLSIVPLLNIAAVFSGFYGLGVIRKNPDMVGKWRCYFGIVSGIVFIIFHIVLAASILSK